ncbi:MAG: helix-turn-helix domain-containing protein [Fimbriiglobus sp.]
MIRPAGKPWTLSEAASFLGVHLHTLRRAIQRKKVKAIRFGRRILIADVIVRALAVDGFR